MPAFPTDIIRATRAARIETKATTITDGRDGEASPQPGYFENAADAQTLLGIKETLIGAFRRRFVTIAQGDLSFDPATTGLPEYQLVDTDLDIDAPGLVTRLEYDMQNEATVLEILT